MLIERMTGSYKYKFKLGGNRENLKSTQMVISACSLVGVGAPGESFLESVEHGTLSSGHGGILSNVHGAILSNVHGAILSNVHGGIFCIWLLNCTDSTFLLNQTFNCVVLCLFVTGHHEPFYGFTHFMEVMC